MADVSNFSYKQELIPRNVSKLKIGRSTKAEDQFVTPSNDQLTQIK